jgi:hypothetical protein
MLEPEGQDMWTEWLTFIMNEGHRWNSRAHQPYVMIITHQTRLICVA